MEVGEKRECRVIIIIVEREITLLGKRGGAMENLLTDLSKQR